METKKLAILINTRDRPTELALLVQSLRTQTFQDFDIFVLDDAGGTPLGNYHFWNCLFTRLKLENHKVFMDKTGFGHGVSKARQKIVDWAMETGDYEYFLRVDDDIILEPDYIERLFSVLKEGYEMASGVTIPMTGPSFKREPKFIGPVVNRVVLNDEGDYVFNGDDCGMEYTESKILPAHHFRSCLLYPSKLHKDGVNYTPTKLSKHGFREEQFLSYKALMKGYKIGVDTGAKNYHMMTPSGGERFPDQNQLIPFNQAELLRWTKENKEDLRKLFPEEPKLNEQQLMKSTNLIMK